MNDTDRLAALLPGIRERHDLTHTPSNTPGCCVEPNGLTAVWCDVGVLLAMVDAQGVRVPTEAGDGLRLALERIATLKPKGPFRYPSDELAEAQGIARAALAAAAARG